MLYSVIVGSRAYGLELESSDYDIGQASAGFDRYCRYMDGRLNNIIELPAKDFIIEQTGGRETYNYTQWLFPVEFLEDNSLTKYILKNREEIILCQLPRLYRIFTEKSAGLEYCADVFYKAFPKRMAYSILLRSILANYAEGMSFTQAHRPEGELHDFLISMREGKIPLEDALARNELERLRAEKAAGFYKEAVHPELLKEFEQVILDQAEKEH